MNETFAKDLAKFIWDYETIWWEQLDQDEIEEIIRNYLSDNKIVLCVRPTNVPSRPSKES